jgi:hypothetical protein
MSAKTFISLMLILLMFTSGLLVFASGSQKKTSKSACPAGATGCAIDTDTENQVQASDGMIWESVSRHLLSAVQ